MFLRVYMAHLCALFWLQSLASAFPMEINVKVNELLKYTFKFSISSLGFTSKI